MTPAEMREHSIEDTDRHLAGLPGGQNDLPRTSDDWVRRSRPGSYRLQLVEMTDAHRRPLLGVRDLHEGIDPEVISVDTWDYYPEHTERVRVVRAARDLG